MRNAVLVSVLVHIGLGVAFPRGRREVSLEERPPLHFVELTPPEVLDSAGASSSEEEPAPRHTRSSRRRARDVPTNEPPAIAEMAASRDVVEPEIIEDAAAVAAEIDGLPSEVPPAEAASSDAPPVEGRGATTGDGALGSVDTGGGIASVAARLRRPIDPMRHFPIEARRRRIAGRTELELVLDAEGRIRRTIVISSEPPGVFEEAARALSRELAYHPARVEGIATASTARLTIRWRP